MRSRVPSIAWTFSLGGLRTGFKRPMARAALGAADRFIVNSRAEAINYSRWLGLDAMMYRRPVVVTHCVGSVDYGVDAPLMRLGDIADGTGRRHVFARRAASLAACCCGKCLGHRQFLGQGGEADHGSGVASAERC